MSSVETRVRQLLEEMLDSDRTAEEVCAQFPELLDEVRRRWRDFQVVGAQLDAIFPQARTVAPDGGFARHVTEERLPSIAEYEVISLLGRGGMGVVYKAKHLKLNRLVAMKMLLAGSFASPAELLRFRREAEVIAGLRHDHIVQIHDFGEWEGRPYFTMEFVESGNLAQKLAGIPQPATECAAIVATLAAAVSAAHQGGIVHRDLKPSNILLTADGTPKVTDFGLARRLEDEAGITQSGVRIGTPSYMAPEQAISKAGAIGPSADIYALGAILYEMLTGRPPFRAETASETERQLISEEPVAPSRLNRMVPRDLETICLTCLQKDPSRRYESAAALAADLTRYQRGEPIAARPTGTPERIAKWVRRHPTATVAIVTSLCLIVSVVGAATWLLSQRAATLSLVEQDLQDVSEQQRRLAWSQATASLERARARLGGSSHNDLRARIAKADRELKLVARLDAIRLERASESALVVNLKASHHEYFAAFRDAGLDAIGDDAEVVAQRIKAMDIRPVLVDALDDWAYCAEGKGQAWLIRVAHLADGSPTDWRARARDPQVWRDKAAMSELIMELTNAPTLARTAERSVESGRSVSLLVMLGWRLRSLAGNAAAIEFLKRVQVAYPADFWANYWLGEALRIDKQSAEAIRFLQAAVAIRPDAAMAQAQLGEALADDSRPDEAIEQFRHALLLQPTWFRPQFDLGITLGRLNRNEEAMLEFENALRLAPDAEALRTMPGVKKQLAVLRASMGKVCLTLNRPGEALDHYQQALKLDPKHSLSSKGVRNAMMAQQQWSKLADFWRQSLEADDAAPHDQWDGYCELLLFMNDDAGYRRARQVLLSKFGATTDANIAERTGRTCLLLAGTEQEMREAAELIDRALMIENAPKWARPYFLFAKALAEHRLGRHESALEVLKGEAAGVLYPAPQLLLSICHARLGNRGEALSILTSVAISVDWSEASAVTSEHWMHHILRREAEALVLPDLPAFLAGRYTPMNNHERLAMTAVCQFEKRYLARARLWSAVLAANPTWEAPMRPSAVSAYAAAGSAQGRDTLAQTDAERAVWRTQARQWIQAELAAADALLNQGESGRHRLHSTLSRWLTSTDLAGVREVDALAKMPDDERASWTTLWKDVNATFIRTKPAK